METNLDQLPDTANSRRFGTCRDGRRGEEGFLGCVPFADRDDEDGTGLPIAVLGQLLSISLVRVWQTYLSLRYSQDQQDFWARNT